MADESYFESAARIEQSDRERALSLRAARRAEEERIAQRLRESGMLVRHCVECGEPIPAARIRLVPHAERCAECEGDHERRRQ